MRSSPKLWLASAVVLLLVACGSAEQAAPKADSEDPFRLAACRRHKK
jgi:hypothetical protein